MMTPRTPQGLQAAVKEVMTHNLQRQLFCRSYQHQWHPVLLQPPEIPIAATAPHVADETWLRSTSRLGINECTSLTIRRTTITATALVGTAVIFRTIHQRCPISRCNPNTHQTGCITPLRVMCPCFLKMILQRLTVTLRNNRHPFHLMNIAVVLMAHLESVVLCHRTDPWRAALRVTKAASSNNINTIPFSSCE